MENQYLLVARKPGEDYRIVDPGGRAPSLQTTGRPNIRLIKTFRPLGPRVSPTIRPNSSTPRIKLVRAFSSKLSCLSAILVSSICLYLSASRRLLMTTGWISGINVRIEYPPVGVDCQLVDIRCLEHPSDGWLYSAYWRGQPHSPLT